MTTISKRHLHPAVVHLLLACFCAIGFAFLAQSVATGKPITGFDSHQATRVHEFAVKNPDVWNFSLWITVLGAGWQRTSVVAGVALFLLLERRWKLALFWAAAQWFLKEAVGVAKGCFERPRPQFEIASYVAGGWSFPSGHATGAMATYGMLAFLIAWRWPGRWFTCLAIGVVGVIILLVGMSRMLLGVHWFTDILGGYLLGLTWVSLCVAVIEWHRFKNRSELG